MKKRQLIGIFCLISLGAFSQEVPQDLLQDQLRKAILNDSAEEVQKAVAAGAKINFGDPNKEPLLHALLASKTKAAQALLSAGANPNIIYQGKKLVHYFLGKSLPVTLLLIKNGADFSGIVQGDQDLFAYILNNWMWSYGDLAQELISKGSDLKPYYTNPDLSKNLFYQSISNEMEVNKKKIPPFSFFISHGASINQVFTASDGTTWTPLLIAIDDYRKNLTKKNSYAYSTSAIEQIIKHGADLNQKAKPIAQRGFQNPLSFALFLTADSDSDAKRGLTNRLLGISLQKLVDFGEVIEFFLEAGGNPNSTILSEDFITWSLLGFSVDLQNVRAVRALLNGGADANSRSIASTVAPNSDKHSILRKRGHFTPLWLALQKPNTEIIELLLSRGGIE